MNSAQDFNKLYTDISESVSAAMEELSTLTVEHKEGKQELTNIRNDLEKIKNNFNKELKNLEDHAEWEKFTIAFFGETNAGKSTIIESLRIYYDEESRKKLLEDNKLTFEEHEKNLVLQVSEVRKKLGTVYVEYVEDVKRIRHGVAGLSAILQKEYTNRVKQKMWMFAIGGGLTGSILTVVITTLLGR